MKKTKEKPHSHHRNTHIKDACDYIAAFNKANTGRESHIEVFYDENGNRRKKMVPNAVFFEKTFVIYPSSNIKVGAARLYRVSSDGTCEIPMHDEKAPILFSCIKPALQVAWSYISTKPIN